MLFAQVRTYLVLLVALVALACESFTTAPGPVEAGGTGGESGAGGGSGGQPNCAGVLDACGVCDGAGRSEWYADADGDGLGDPNRSTSACDQPSGYVTDGSDSDPNCHHDFDRDICGVCNGAGAPTWYLDDDDDSLGDPDEETAACDQPDGYVANADDADPTCSANIGRDECGICGGSGGYLWYADTDGDGLGDPDDPTTSCDQPSGYVADSSDADPGCDDNIGRDACNVCAGSGPPRWYADADGDGLGDPNDSIVACAAPAGHVGNSNDTDPSCDDNIGRDACNVCGGTKTECVAPRVINTTPGNGATHVADEEITITFSEPMNTASVEAAFWPAADFTWSNNDATVTALIDGSLPFRLGATTAFTFGLNASSKDVQGNTIDAPLSVSISLAQIRREELTLGWAMHQSGNDIGYSWFLAGDLYSGVATHGGAAFDISSLPSYSSITSVRSARLVGVIHDSIGSSPGNIELVIEQFSHGRNHRTFFDSSLVVTELGSLTFGGRAPVEFDDVELDVTDAFDAFWSDPSRPDTDFSIRIRPRFVINNGSTDHIRFKRSTDEDDDGVDVPDEAFRVIVEYL